MRIPQNAHPPRGRCLITFSALLCAFSAAGATDSAGQNEQQAELADALARVNKPYAEIRAGAWLPRLGGETRFDSGLGSSQIVLKTELDLNDLEVTANLELTLAKSNLALHFSGFTFSTSSRGGFDARPPDVGPQQFGSLTLMDGDPFRADFDFSSAAIELQFLQLGMRDAQLGDEPGVAMSIVPTLAARWIGVEQSISSPGGSDEANADWLGFLFGVSMETVWRPDLDQPLFDRVTFGMAVSIGPAVGSGCGFLWHVRTGIHIAITPTLGFELGYRLLELDLDSDEFTVEAGLQGMFLGGSMRF